jgi:hypothetical protein
MAFSPRSAALRLQLGGPMQSVEPPLNDPFAVGPFSLGDYFDIEEPGEYAITVWPKVYKRDATNSDVCHRIDLPPVSAKFKWSGSSKK